MAKRPQRTYKEEKEIRRRWKIALTGCVVASFLAIGALNGAYGVPTWGALYELVGMQADGVPQVHTDAHPPLAHITPRAQDFECVDVGETQVHFIDVGQGDATLIVQSDEYGLIDAGTNESEDALLAYLNELGVEELEFVLMTHPHADHIGGMDAVIQQFDVRKVIFPDFTKSEEPPTGQHFARVLEAIEETETPMVTAQLGDCYLVGSGLLVVVSTGIETENLNNISLGTKYTAGKFSFLTTGDAEAPVEEAMLSSGRCLTSMLYKAAHHGSATSNTAAFLQAVTPEFSIISCGVENSFGHPDRAVLARFEAQKIAYYATAQEGNIVVTHSIANGLEVWS